MRTLVCTTALALLFACSGNKDSDSDTPTGVTTGQWVTGSGGSGTNTGTATGSGGSGSGGSGSTSENTITTYVGDAAVDVAGASWTGTESVRVLSAASGTLLCQWTWDAIDWANDPAVSTMPEPAATPCTDEDGNACAFSFAVNLSNGAETDGLCGTYGFDADGGAYHYGYSADWMRGTTSYGEQFTYYLPNASGGQWIPAQDMGYGFFTWTPPGTGPGQLHYELNKTLLSSYTSP